MTTSPTAEALAHWDKDIGVMQESIKLMLSNRLAEADALVEEGTRDIAARTIDFNGGDHDLRGGFAFVNAVFALLNGLASLEKDQLETALARIWAADELLVEDGDWIGKTVLRGICILVAGVVQIMQGSYAKGAYNALRSWLYLRYLESEGLNFVGHESNAVRSTSLFGLGIFNLIVSILPPHLMRSACFVTGFTGGLDTAWNQLRMCFDEGGICAAFAGLVLVSFAVDISNWLGEFPSVRNERLVVARTILDWANEHHGESFFYQGLESSYRAVVRDVDGAISKIQEVSRIVEDKPAFVFIVHLRTATLLTFKCDWVGAAQSYLAAAEVHRSVGRRAMCPTLMLNAHLCYTLAGDHKEAADEALQSARSYRQEKKKWGGMDADSLKLAERAHQAATGEVEEGVDEDANANAEPWRGNMLFYTKVCVIYRGVTFMPQEQAMKFTDLIKAEAEECSDSVDMRVLGLFLQAEAMRQLESWDKALELIAEAKPLFSDLSPIGKKKGSEQFLYLIAAYSHYAKGNLSLAQDALAKLDALGSDHYFSKTVSFKATHLKKLLGVEIKDSYKEIAIGARSKAKFLVDVAEDIKVLELDWVLQEKSISFRAFFRKHGGVAAGYVSSDASSDPIEVRSVDQYEAASGPCEVNFEVPGPGQLELVFDNSFSMLTGKTVRCRLQPESLSIGDVIKS